MPGRLERSATFMQSFNHVKGTTHESTRLFRTNVQEALMPASQAAVLASYLLQTYLHRQKENQNYDIDINQAMCSKAINLVSRVKTLNKSSFLEQVYWENFRCSGISYTQV